MRVDTGDGVTVEFAVSRATVSVTLPAAQGADASVEVRNGLAFRGQASINALDVVLGSDVDTAAGIVHARAADAWRVTEAIAPTGAAAAARGRLRLFGLLTSEVDVPCAALTLARVPPRSLSVAATRPATTLASTVDTLELRAEATGSVQLRLETSRLAPVPLEPVSRVPGFVQVRARWSRGSTLTGWAAESSLGPLQGRAGGQGFGGSSHSRCGPGLHAGDREGPVTLRVSAPVYGSAEGTTSWAQVAASTGSTALLRAGARRAALITIAGVDGQPQGWCQAPRAWVDVGDVTFARRAPARAPEPSEAR